MPKVLILVLAYHVEDQVGTTLARIPTSVLEDEDVHVLVIDNASTDRSSDVGAEWASSALPERATVIRNQVNQGYGGSQKLGYRFAVDAGFDLVVMVHGDGQYAPEHLPAFLETWKRTQADVILGTRMHSLESARQGGMPLYKLVGNRVLTTFQNVITGQRLSEYHTGYRAYSGAFLRSIPFELCTNDFHFDTEILLQAFDAEARIVELPIPTHYGDETCNVNGMEYALDVALSTARFALQRYGLFTSLKYRRDVPARYGRSRSERYAGQRAVLDRITALRPRRILDLATRRGHLAQRCRELGAEVVGIDRSSPEPGSVDAFHRADLEQEDLPVDPHEFDVLLAVDLLEDLALPERLLLKLRNQSRAAGNPNFAPRLLVTSANVAFVSVRLNLLLGRFNYGERGILDVAHKRLLTRAALVQMLEDCGYTVDEVAPVGVPFDAVVGGPVGFALERASDALARLWPTLFAFQFLVVCRPLPSARQLLGSAERRHVSRATAAQLDAAAEVGAARED